MEETIYISVREAAARAHYSARHFHRFLDRGEIAFIRENSSSIKVEVASLNTFLERRGERAIDPLEQVKKQLEEVQKQLAAQTHVNGKLTLEDAELRNAITKWAARIEALEAKVHALSGHRAHGAEAVSPDGTIMLVDFAKRHAVSISKLRTLAAQDPTLATIIERPYAIRMKHKWLIGLDQQACMIAALQAREIAYTPCGECPHGVAENPPFAQ